MLRGAMLLVMTLTLSGCYQWATYLEEDALLVHQASQDYIKENIERRKRIRSLCDKILYEEVVAYIKEGDFLTARTALGLAYPPLVTPSIIKEKDLSRLDKAATCE